VSRSALEATRSSLLHLHGLLDAEIERNHRLLDRLEALQRAGFTDPAPVRYTDTTPAIPDEILSAILARSPGLGSEMGQHLVAFALEEMARETPTRVIADRIWGETEEQP